MKNMKRIKIGALISYFYVFFNIAVGLIYTPWVVKEIGQSNYAIYNIAISLIAFFTIDFGLNSSISRYVAIYAAKNDKKGESVFLGIATKMYALLDISILICLVFLYFFIGNIYAKLTPNEIENLKVVFIICASYSIAAFPFQALSGVFIAKKYLYINKTIDIIQKFLTVITMVIVLLMGYKLYALVWVNVFAGVFAITCKLGFLVKHNLIEINLKAKDFKLVKEIFNFSVWSSISSIFGRITFTAMPTILAALSGSPQVVYFAFASTIEGYVHYFTTVLGDLFLPQVTQLVIENDKSKILDLLIKVGRIQMKIISLILIGFLLLGKEFILLWIGSEYISVYYTALLIIAPYFISATQDIALTMVTVTGKMKEKSFISIASGLTILALSLVLIPQFGVIGSGIAIYFGMMIYALLANLLYKRLQINMRKFYQDCHLKSLPSIFLSIIICGLVLTVFPSELSWVLFLVKAILVVLIFCLVSWNLNMNKYEKNLIATQVQIITKKFIKR